MRAVIQRVSQASVEAGGQIVGAIGPGLLILVGVKAGDTWRDSVYLAEKLPHFRIFEDDAGKMNLSLLETKGQALIVSQFTLCADTSKGKRPSFAEAAQPALAKELYEDFVARIKGQGIITATGEFGAMMKVSLVNDGPVTFVMDSKP